MTRKVPYFGTRPVASDVQLVASDGAKSLERCRALANRSTKIQ